MGRDQDCALCAEYVCCPEHCCDWDECDCGDCVMCGGEVDAKRSEEALQAEAEEAKRAEEEVERIAMAEMRERRTMERAEAECRPLQAHWTMAYQRRRRRAAQSAEMKAREPTPEEKRAEEALVALKRYRDELRESVERLAGRVAVYRRKADAAAKDLRGSESQLAALGRQADACVGMLTMDKSGGDGEAKAVSLPAGFIDPSRCDACAASLERNCYAVVDDFLPRELVEALSAEMRAAHDASVARGDLAAPHASASGAAGAPDSGGGEAKAGAVGPDVIDASEVAVSLADADGEAKAGAGPDSDVEPLRFQFGRLGGGATGSGLRYAHPRVRGDHFTWLRQQEPAVPHLEAAFEHLDALALHALPDRVPGLGGRFLARGMAMAAFYPGGGARYVRHCDNPHGNGRILTLLLYLTPQWREGDGGGLRLYPDPSAAPCTAHSTLLQRRGRTQASAAGAAGAAGQEAAVTIEPLLNRAAMFWSDARVPHEVLPTVQPRWAVTVWYVDVLEVAGAQAPEGGAEDTERVRAEIDKFEQAYGRVHALEQ